MCLTAPALVASVEGEWAVVELDDTRRRASLALVPGAVAGDWVLVAAGLVLEVLDDEALRALRRLLDSPHAIPEGVRS